jgi:inorganic pyrophosphatase
MPDLTSFPFDFGFIPSTPREDGAPLDVMVLMNEPAHVGCLPEVLPDQIEAFFVSYNKLHGKKFKVTGRGGPKRALAISRERHQSV